MNVDENEISKHETIKNWWDINGPMMGLHAMNNLRILFISNGLENCGKLKPQDGVNNLNRLAGIKIIDVGCGGGILCEALAKLGAEVTGIDPSEILIDVAKQHAADNKLSGSPIYLTSSIEDHSSKNPDKYDVVVASEVIEHVPDKQLFLNSCVKTLKPGGSVFLTTPNRTSASWLGSILVAENVFRLLPKGTHDWEKFVTPTELQQMLYKSNCRTVLVNGMLFNVFTKKWSWTQSTLLHYAMHAVKKNTFN